jgi:hypothetical protein
MAMMTTAKREWYRKNYARIYAKQREWMKNNPEKVKEYQAAYQRRNPEKRRAWCRKYFREKFFKQLGITQADYDKMFFRQEGRCWICMAEPATHKGSPDKLLIVDHDHDTGEIRGLLCQNCNKALGLFRDDLGLVVRAVDYLVKHAKEVAA